MKTKVLLPVLLVASVVFTACSVHKSIAYGDTETKVLGTELDGVYVVRATGRYTKNDVPAVARTRAMEQAKKRAVYDITFSILNSNITSEKTLKPVLTEVNVREKYQDYFDNFFSEKGAWREYASTAGSRYVATKFYSSSTDVVCIMSVRVDRKGLIAKFKEDNIIK